jgi:hypothetical protein
MAPSVAALCLLLVAAPAEGDGPAITVRDTTPGKHDPSYVTADFDGLRLVVDFTPTLLKVFPPEEDEDEREQDAAGDETPPDEPGTEAVDDAGGEEGAVANAPASQPVADDGEEADAEAEGGALSFFVLPDVRYNPDEGLGLGVAIPLVWTEPGVKPYKYNFVLQLVTSTKLVQDQALLFDIVDILGLPLRFSGQAGFYAFADEPFCGVGSTASCDAEEAQRAVAASGLEGDEAAEALERYYLMRIVRPYGWGIVRVGLFDLDLFGKWEVFGGLRSEAYFPGFFGNVLQGELFDPGPYRGTLFEKRAADGEPGFVNLPQVGIMVDTRDFEPSPRAGYWVEASLRGAHPWALSSWGFGGANFTGRMYVPLHSSRTLTLATRFIADVIVGDAPVQELARFGGSQDYRGFGGRWVGRGLRQQRFIGNLKMAYQTELRWDALRFDVGGFSLGFEFVGFLDVGVVMSEGIDYSFNEGLLRPPRPLIAYGVGLRWVINRNIVIRADVGISPDEGFNPLFYFDGRHIY